MSWLHQANCRDEPTNIWFPEGTGSLDYATAKAICETCPVTQQCLKAGINEPDGVWGGLSPVEREHLRGKRYPGAIRARHAAVRPCQICGNGVYMGRANQKYCIFCKDKAARKTKNRRRDRGAA